MRVGEVISTCHRAEEVCHGAENLLITQRLHILRLLPCDEATEDVPVPGEERRSQELPAALPLLSGHGALPALECHGIMGHQVPREDLEALGRTRMLLHAAWEMPKPPGRNPPLSTLPATYCSGGCRTTNPMSFLNQLASRSALGSLRGDSSSHTTSRSCCWGSQKGCSNSRKILLLVPKPRRRMASAFRSGRGGWKKSWWCSLRKPTVGSGSSSPGS